MPRRIKVFRSFLQNVVTAVLVVREVLVCLVILIFLHGLLFSYVEGKDIGSSIYFAFITAFTIGYGDIVPATTLGRIVAVLMGLWGTIFVGLVVAINTRALRETVKAVTPQEPA
jgi:voltage-gated potassium channel